MQRPPIHYCKACGHAVVYRVPDDGDTKVRAVCPQCYTIHYENPLNVVGTIAVWQDQVLLCKRNIEPRKGLWTLPAGFMELGETVAQGAARETSEEAGAQFVMQELFSVISVPHVGQVHLFFRAQLTSTVFAPGIESMEARLFKEDDIPWEEIAFRTTKSTLQRYFADYHRGQFGVHTLELEH